MLKRLFSIKVILIIIILLLVGEISLRLKGSNPFRTESPHFWETNFQYDSYFGWSSKSNFTVDLKSYGFKNTLVNILFNSRGFPKIPYIDNDTVRNEKKMMYIGRCYTYGGPMVGADKGFLNLLAQEASDRLDFEVIGVSGYSFYQLFLLNKKFNAGDNDLVIVSFCPMFDFSLDTKFYLRTLNNRYVPKPIVKENKLHHDPVPYVKSHWEYKLPPQKRFNLKEVLFRNCYLLSWAANLWVKKSSFDIDLTKHIVKELKENVESKGGRLALFIFDFAPDFKRPYITEKTDEFVLWLKEHDVDVIDVRQKLIGHSLAEEGDYTHINSEGNVIMKNEMLLYLKNNGFISTN